MAYPPSTINTIIELLRQHPDGLTFAEMQEMTGRCYDTLWGCVQSYRKRNGNGLIYICRYQQQVGKKGKASPVFSINPGNKHDAKRPEPVSNIERWRRYAARHSANIKSRQQIYRRSTLAKKIENDVGHFGAMVFQLLGKTAIKHQGDKA